VVRKHNKPRPRVAHRGIARFLEIDQKCNQVVHGHATPSLKISCKSVQPFSRNLANKETKKERKKDTYIQTKKSIENNTPSPVSSLAVALTVASIHYAHPRRDGQTE